VKLAARLAKATGMRITPADLFEHPTPREIAREIASFAAQSGAEPAALHSAEALVSFLSGQLAELVGPAVTGHAWPRHPPGRSPAHPSSIGLDAEFVSPSLTRLSAGGAAMALFASPTISGHCEAYGSLAAVVPTTSIYAFIHPHLQIGDDNSLCATKLDELAMGWALAAVGECELCAHESFALVGCSFGGLLSHLVGLAYVALCEGDAGKRGSDVRRLTLSNVLLVDPLPPSRPWSTAPTAEGVRASAQALLLLMTGGGWDDSTPPADVAEADLAIAVAERKVALGMAAFTPQTVRETARELRVATHLMGLASTHTAAPTGLPAQHGAEVTLFLAEERVKFFTSVEGLTHQEASAETARLYGNVTREATITGGHLDAVSRCQVGEDDVFNAILREVLQ